MESDKSKTVSLPHISVLAAEVAKSFDRCGEGLIIDCTLGYGGHSELLLDKFPGINIVGIDRDQESFRFSKMRLKRYEKRIEYFHGSFSKIVPEILKSRKIAGVLADFGVSSPQLDKKDRGFSFSGETLDMRMDRGSKVTARDIVNSYSASDLAEIFKKYGEIAQAERVADAIVKQRAKHPIEKPQHLLEISRDILFSRGKIHPATLLFQALRIEVNDELGEIERLLDTLELHRPDGAVLTFITFHSLEDRLVKMRFKNWAKSCICDDNVLRCSCGNNNSLGKIITKKPVCASKKEISENPRSRSAKLRSFVFGKKSGTMEHE